MIPKEVEDDRETWLYRVNIHLEKLLHKAKKDNKMLKNFSNRYIKRNKFFNIKLKQLQEKRKQTLAKQKEGDKLEIIAEAFLHAQHTSSATILQFFAKF